MFDEDELKEIRKGRYNKPDTSMFEEGELKNRNLRNQKESLILLDNN